MSSVALETSAREGLELRDGIWKRKVVDCKIEAWSPREGKLSPPA